MKNWYRSKHLPIILLLAAALLIGFLTVKDYGESWDEADIYRYADYTIHAYSFFLHPHDLQPFLTNLNFYGPAYFMAADLTARVFAAAVLAWSRTNAWHFTYFLTFLGCGLAIYLLCRRWVSDLSAFGATLLFLSQPLLWGHAFMNPKDLPFMAFFTGSILLGLKMVDRYKAALRPDIMLVLAAILLGATASIRVVGPWAGLIVLAYGVYKIGSRVVPMAAFYVILAALINYMTWPYLWTSFITHYIESFSTMTQFPFQVPVLFLGKPYAANQLPRAYFPTFLTLQLTEPALLLVGIGVALSAVQFYRKENRDTFALLVAWFLIPVAVIIASRSPLYDNARQLYFLFPELFIVTGLAFEKLLVFLRHPAAKAAFLLATALPGIYAGLQLHPYEYVYYNALVGGTGGAFRLFEMDYWAVSFKDMAEHLNAVAAPNAHVLVFGPRQIVDHYVRPDIRVFVPVDHPPVTYDYAIILTRENLDEYSCTDAIPIYSEARSGAVFSVLKRIPAGTECK